jgi:hypothetical protein
MADRDTAGSGGGSAAGGGGFGERLGQAVKEFVDKVVETLKGEGGKNSGEKATGPKDQK